MLYTGVNYHPHDWPEARWPEDVRLMKEAGFTTVRLGHLCWDSFEPEDGAYTFDWFDRVMDLFAEAGIGVVLDLSTHPAPLWVHDACPGVNIVAHSGAVQAPLRRYTEDVADPDYQRYALRFCEKLILRYKDHPALFAFGLCNELGDGYMSFSEPSRQRFITWLKAKYGSVKMLNKAWATQRWSRRMNSFEQVAFPESELAKGSPEAWLDMRRFFSDGIGGWLVRLKELVERLAPGIPHSSNHYAEKKEPGFDYLKFCPQAVQYPGIGMYPGSVAGAHDDANLTYYHHRLAETGRPMWCLEFQSGGQGYHHYAPGLNYMYAMLTLLYRNQMVLGWTWRSMYGGEEQFLGGLLDHDGTPNVNYTEYCRIQKDYETLSCYALPHLPQPEIAVAFSRESEWQTQYHLPRFHQTHQQQVCTVTHALIAGNRDFNMVDLRRMTGNYRLLIVPMVTLMDAASAETVRSFVQNGGTVLMTAESALVDETSKVFTESLPGRLSDVFGIRVVGYDRPDTAAAPKKLIYGEATCPVSPDYWEQVELRGAAVLACFDDGTAAVTEHRYGSGCSMYLTTQPTPEIITLLLKQLPLSPALVTPKGIYARQLAEGQTLYVNSNPETVTLQSIAGRCVLHGGESYGELLLGGYSAELVVSETEA